MNPRQRRGVLLLIATGIGAVVVFFAISAYVSSVASQVGNMVPVVTLTRDVEALEPVRPEMVEVVERPERWVPETALRSLDQAAGLVSTGPFRADTMLQDGMLTEAPGLNPGFREVAIMVDAETGVAGKVSSGDRVDILATTVDPGTDAQRAEVWVSSALVIEVGLPQPVEGEDVNGGFDSSQGVPVTFALSTADALRVAYAESFAVKLRLALRGLGDESDVPAEERVYEQIPGVAR
ncbi:Flp pilus assembly protein CpaB [Georgenia sp. SYP-B2076]|uniref:Flp pilus assembly protein CpaB n=1 Tax=Georgenia sp. SYP-B2076 TaxID=2495881 RepID=UPI000F8E798B|nr:Flp pilus assembly protein CpaB [Georgenia sp. SYP-B2076]